jgi:hypothetical protein
MKLSLFITLSAVVAVMAQTKYMQIYNHDGKTLLHDVAQIDSVKFCEGALVSNLKDTLNVLIDNRISSNTSSKFGTDSLLWVGAYDNYTISRALIQFNLPKDFELYQIKSAKMELTYAKWLTAQDWVAGDHFLTMQPVIGAWDEVNTSAIYKSQNVAWNITLGDTLVDFAQAKDTATITYPQASFQKQLFDIKNVVEFWKNNVNNGLVIRTHFEKKGRYYPAFYSKEALNQMYRPRLILEYDRTQLSCAQ